MNILKGFFGKNEKSENNEVIATENNIAKIAGNIITEAKQYE